MHLGVFITKDKRSVHGLDTGDTRERVTAKLSCVRIR